ncbi:MDR family MFS transporter [Actinoallomurus acanthiterrae]
MPTGRVRLRLPPELRRAIAVVMIGASLSFLDSTIVNVSLRTLSVDLHASLDDIQWVVTGYLLALAAVIPVTGWAARRVGAARLYVIALAVFTAGSAMCALSGSAGELIAFRVLQGAGGGMITPVGTMIWAKMAGPERMARVMSAVGMPIVLAPMLGPTLGGLLVQELGWQSIFWLNVPAGIIGVILATRLLPRDQAQAAGPLDVPGLLLITAGMVGLTYGLTEVATAGGVGRATVFGLGGGVVLLAMFVLRALRVSDPLLDLRLYRDASFGAASLTAFSLGIALFGGVILMPLYFQLVRGESVIATGLLLAPSGLGAAVANRLSAPLTERLGAGLTSLIGAGISLAATMPFVLIKADTSCLALGAAMLVRGFGVGISLMPAMTATYRSLPAAKINDATPQLNILQRVGGSIGTAVLTVVLQHGLRGATGRTAQAAAFATTFWWVLAVAALAALPTTLLTVIERRK